VTGRREQSLAAGELQTQLRDLLCLAVVADHVRWVLVGDGAAELAGRLTAAAATWRALADQVAKRLATLGVAPDGRVRALAQDIPLNWVPDGWLGVDEASRLLADRLTTLAEWARYRRSQALDPDTVRLLERVCTSLDRSP
jgi:starvation-inducible DNA-binding protein